MAGHVIDGWCVRQNAGMARGDNRGLDAKVGKVLGKPHRSLDSGSIGRQIVIGQEEKMGRPLGFVHEFRSGPAELLHICTISMANGERVAW